MANDPTAPGAAAPQERAEINAFVPWLYPSALEAEITTRDGATLHMRPIRPDDTERLLAFHHRLSEDSIYRRYFSMHPELSTAELAHLTRVDYVDRLALEIEDGDRLVAVGRYDQYPFSTKAEVAFVVADDYQHQGLGLRLLEHLAAAAWDRGITSFTAETMASNRDMMSVFYDSGFPVKTVLEDDDISVRFSIEPTEESRARRHERRGRGRRTVRP